MEAPLAMKPTLCPHPLPEVRACLEVAVGNASVAGVTDEAEELDVMLVPASLGGIPGPAREAGQETGALGMEPALFVGSPLFLHPHPEAETRLDTVLANKGVTLAPDEGDEQAVGVAPAVLMGPPGPPGQLFEPERALRVDSALLVGQASSGYPLSEGKSVLDMALRHQGVALPGT
jgi:hypothetical protein